MAEKSTRYFSNKSEKAGAKALGMKQQVNSGATKFNKGDIIDDSTVLDDKTCTAERDSIVVKKEWFKKIAEEMFAMGRRFCGVRFNFGNPKESYIAVPEKDFKELYDAWKELYGNE